MMSIMFFRLLIPIGFLLLVVIYFCQITRVSIPLQSPKHFGSKKIILSWNGYYHLKQFMTPDLKVIRCPVTSCHVTSNRDLIDVSDAVVIHLHDAKAQDLPDRKRPGQRWILMNLECPMYDPDDVLSLIGPNIDWTLTYRTDSDIPWPYGEIRTKQDGPPAPTAQADPTKQSVYRDMTRKRAVAWLASHCITPCKREDIATELSKFIPVDVYGGCGKALPFENRSQAFQWLAKRYSFYLSFENSICKDYVTEKAFQALYHGLIPVVFGGANYKVQLPPGSYIDVLDFLSLQQLADHLTMVLKNMTSRTMYLKWREQYDVTKREGEDSALFCEICSKLESRETLIAKDESRRDLKSWWNRNRDCVPVLEESPMKYRRLLKSIRESWYRNN